MRKYYTMTDITKHKETEEELRKSEAKYRMLFEISNDGFWWADKHGYVTEANAGTALMLGYCQEEMVGRFWTDFVDDEWLDKGYKEWEARKSGKSSHYEIKLKKKDGSSIWTKVSGAPQKDEDGQYTGTLVAFIDITEQKKSELELIKSEKKALALVSELKKADDNKNEFISMLSHELRNPLATISVGIGLLELTNKSEENLKTINILKRQTEHLSRLVDDLLDISRIAQKKTTLSKENIILNTIVNHAIADIKPQFEEKGINFLDNICTQPIVVKVDSFRITQCIGNILKNALKFTQENNTVSISLRIDGKSAVIDIQDNGIGISPEMIGKIFEPFTQESRSSSDSHNRGLGLGLALVKEFIEMHDGEVTASSTGLGKGSLFTLRLPILL